MGYFTSLLFKVKAFITEATNPPVNIVQVDKRKQSRIDAEPCAEFKRSFSDSYIYVKRRYYLN